MGGGSSHQQEDSGPKIPPDEVWLLNQTFPIKDESYTLLDRRGGGAFGSVWASRTAKGRPAAVKVFNLGKLNGSIPTRAIVDSFQEEVKMAYRMRDAKYHVVYIYGFDFDIRRSLAFVAMELGDDTLEDRAKALHMNHRASPMFNGDFISPMDRKSIWMQLVQIVIVLHQHNIVHRDMKPPNLVFFGPILKVVDLGIAQKVVAGYASGKRGGTYFYSGPECFQMGARVTSKADIWSLGAILYHLVYGSAPQSWSPQPPYPLPPTRSPLVQDLLMNCLQRDPNRRPSHQSLARHPLTSGPALG